MRPEKAEGLCRNTIEKYLGSDALERFAYKREKVRKICNDFKKRIGLETTINEIINQPEKLENLKFSNSNHDER